MSRILLTLFKRDLCFFMQPIVFTIWGFFLFIHGFNFCYGLVFLNHLGNELSTIKYFFSAYPFWFICSIISPLITIPLFLKEEQSGNIEYLCTLPITDFQIIVSKFLVALCIYIIFWIPVFSYFLVFYSQTNILANLQTCFSVYLLLILLGSFYNSICAFISVLILNKLLSTIMLIIISFLFFDISLIFFGGINQYEISEIISFYSPIQQMKLFLEGIYDTRPVIFYLLGTLLFLFLTHHIFYLNRSLFRRMSKYESL